MRKFILASLTLLLLSGATIEAQTKKGTYILSPQITSFNLSLADTEFRERGIDFGLQVGAGTFVLDNLATKVSFGFGYNDTQGTSLWVVGINASIRYYILSRIITGISFGYEYQGLGKNGPKYNYLPFEVEAGYAFFLGKNFSLEPSLYWKYSLLDKFSQVGFKVGFGYHF